MKEIDNFLGFEKTDENPYYKITFAEKGIIQLRFLEAEISTRLDKARCTVKFHNGNETLEEKVSLDNYLTIRANKSLNNISVIS